MCGSTLALACGPFGQPQLLLGVFGFLAASSTLNYAQLSQHFGRHLTGRANTALDLMVFFTAFLVQWGCGVVLKAWGTQHGAGYAAVGYGAAFGILVTLQTLALAWFFLAPWLRR